MILPSKTGLHGLHCNRGIFFLQVRDFCYGSHTRSVWLQKVPATREACGHRTKYKWGIYLLRDIVSGGSANWGIYLVWNILSEGYTLRGIYLMRDIVSGGFANWGIYLVRDILSEGCTYWGIYLVRDILSEGITKLGIIWINIITLLSLFKTAG